jgi:signal transduction histidine kinase
MIHYTKKEKRLLVTYLSTFFILLMGITVGGYYDPVFASSAQFDLGEMQPQDPLVMTILMIANGVIALSYASIPVSLVVFVYKRKDVPFSWVFGLFSAFILACGTTHAMHVISIWRQTPMSWWQAGVDSLTAVVSLTSAIVIWPLLPRLLSIPSPAQLQTVNRELEHEKVILEKTQDELRRAYTEVEQRVADRTVELVQANQALQMEITARKQAEEEIRQLNASLEQRVEERTRELRDAHEQLVRSEKLAVLGQLAGSVGHELRHPLGVISNAVYFLKMALPDAPEKIKEYLNIVENETRASDKIVNDLLDFTRVKSLGSQSVSIPDVIRQTLERYPAPKSVQVTLDLPSDLPRAYADPQHLVQILGNLTLNAVQAMPNGGNLVISSYAPDDMICIAVKDTGIGVPPENMKNLFEPLFTTKPKGIGLGLAVSKKLVEAGGGRIEAQSEAGMGSVFSIYIPIFKEVS